MTLVTPVAENSSDGGSRPGAIMAAVVLVITCAILVTIAVIAGGRGRDDFGPGSIRDLTVALTGHGLVVCSSRTAKDNHGAAGLVSSTVLGLAVPGDCDEAADLQVDAYKDSGHRDAAARNAEAVVRPRAFGMVYTWQRCTLYLQGDDASVDSGLRDRIVDSLDSIGAR
ncbi:MAG: hypothetical protein JWM76_4023 [Pseudonocardiales bacterium]|nr:hypothetical protein [Pseudonocardiales bacterium]